MFWCVAYALEFVDDTQQCCQATFDIFKKRQKKCSADELVNAGEVRFPSPVARNSECAIVYFIAFQEKFARVQKRPRPNPPNSNTSTKNNIKNKRSAGVAPTSPFTITFFGT